MESSFDGGQILTKPLLLRAPNLHLNVNARFGEVNVALLDRTGQVIAQSNPVSQDGLDVPVIWRTAPPDLAAPLGLRIGLKNARLFALWTAKD